MFTDFENSLNFVRMSDFGGDFLRRKPNMFTINCL